MATEIDVLAPAGIWRRVGARLCDSVFIFVLLMVGLVVVACLDSVIALNFEWVFGAFLLGAVGQIFYFGYGNANGRCTWGYRLAGLRLENLQHQPLSLGRNLWRSLLSQVTSNFWLYGGFLDFLVAIFNAKKRTGHDFACGSQVISVAKPRLFVLWSLPLLLVLFFTLWTSQVIFPAALRAYYIPAGSMEPTLRINDRMLVNLLVYHFRAPRNGEIAVFEAPAAALLNQPKPVKVDFVKRVVGTPGDVVSIVDRQLYRNGIKVQEPYCQWDEAPGPMFTEVARYSYDMKVVGGQIYSRDSIGSNQKGPWMRNGVAFGEKEQQRISTAKPEAVPANCYIALGDHRSNSNDSHVFGFVPRSAFQGRAMLIHLPFSHWKSL